MARLLYLLVCLSMLVSSPILTAQQATNNINEVINIIKHQPSYPNYVLVSAHRGYWANFPENTREAYDAAIELGADIIEMDIRLTKDDQMVVFHDACLDRMTTGYGRLREEDWDYVNSLYLKNEDGTTSLSKILLLSDALDYMKGKAVIALDIKEGGALFKTVMIRALEMLKEKGMLYQTIVKGKLPLSDLNSVLDQAKVTLDDFIYTPIAFSNTPNLVDYVTDLVSTKKIYAFELVYKQTEDLILQMVPQVMNHGVWIGNYSFWPETGDGVVAEKIPLTDTDPIVRNYDFQNKDLSNFLDDGRGDWDWLMSYGSNYVITDRSDLLIEYLKQQGRRTK